jgi:glutamine amidotransferase
VKVAIVNYGMGNLGSVRRAFEELGVDVSIADHPAALYDANRVVLPGVGAFGQGMQNLDRGGWRSALQDIVQNQQKPLLGICLGMQMLATVGHEGGESQGLGFVPGHVRRLDTLGCKLRVPHVGWNEVHYAQTDGLVESIPDNSDFYFVHSFALVPDNPSDLVASTPYGCEFAAIVRNGNVFGTQFHPEKSSRAGLRLLRNFLGYVPC